MKEYLDTLIHSPVALIGLLASIIVLVSMCFNTTTTRGTILMRVVNLLGSVISVVYGIILGVEGAGMILLNGILIFVNLYYVVRVVFDDKKNSKAQPK